MSRREADTELQQLAVQSKRRRRVPTDARCEVCGTEEQLSQRADGRATCYEHLKQAAGSVELDHLFGRAVVAETVIPLRANDHRRITDLRRTMGMDDLPPPDGDPLLLLAHILHGVASLLVLIAEWLVDRVTADRGNQQPPPFPVVA